MTFSCEMPVCWLIATGLYYMVASTRGAAVRAYTSEDLVDWTGPYIVYRTPSEIWGEPVVLFRGSDAPWAERQEYGSWVTDGPWLYTSESGKLFMVWSSFGEGGYTVGLAVSESGRLEGPWEQQAEPLYSDYGGHPMLFESLEGQLMMALHSPNTGPNQRIHLFEMKDTGETLQVVKRLDT